MPTEPVAVVGAGNWGTTLAHLVASNGHPTRLWTRDRARSEEINTQRTHARWLPDLILAPGVTASISLEDVVAPARFVLIAVPSQAFREVCRQLGEVLRPEQLVVHGTKGLEAATHRRMTQILQEETCARQIGVLSGPNIAPEIARANRPAR